ncbi:DUF397 domain-containing protein [Nocardiopsis sediminis]|uniref:DUF397 domain-containing protein n=1 Tax=Nocardiopsis sediminis TaxID=1778267 RepID=A0ABV8FRR2_9ACTN
MLDERWHKSTRSYGGGECLECRTPDGRVVQVRDTMNREAGHLVFPAPEWRALLIEVERL